MIKSRLVFIENKVCSEHYGRQNCGKAKCPHKSTGIGCSGDAMNRSLQTGYAFVLWPAERFLCRKVLQKLAFSAERIVIGLLSVSVTFALALLAVRSVRSTKKNRFELQFQGLSTEDIELSVSDSRICADLISNAERKMNSLTGGGNSSP